MNEPIKTESQTMSSREIAELTGKRHSDVLRDVDKLLESLSADLRLGFQSTTYADNTGKSNRMFSMDKDSTTCLVTGYDANARMRIIKRWQELESAQPKQIALTPAQALHQMTGLMVEQERRVAVVEDKVARIEAKQAAFEDGAKFFTIIGYVVWRGMLPIAAAEAALMGKKATKLSKERGVMIDRVRDPRYGMVGSYHESVLNDVFEESVEGM